MVHEHAYPPELARYVKEHWPKGRTLPVSQELFCQALSVAFQASLTAEEARPVRFRLLLTPVDSLPESGVPNQGVLRLRFDRSRPLTAEELRRLSPSTPFEASLIGLHAEGALAIWGIAHSGPARLAPSWGGRYYNWTYDPIIRHRPGQIAVRCAGKLIGRSTARSSCGDGRSTRSGCRRCSRASEKRFARSTRHSITNAVADERSGGEGDSAVSASIQLVRTRHGGIVLFVDTEAATSTTA
jgi:hypothetical protein